ncbi:MAG: response regulator [candidate division Zixibacteria bacterium]|nr:response regulator [candidate division Zixibacteria bacterium]
MAVIAIFSGSYCHGEDVAGKVAKTLNYERLEDKLLEETSKRFNVSEDKLVKAMTGSTSLLSKLTRDRQKHIAYLRSTLADLILDDNRIFHGYAAHLLPSSIPHVLKVCLIANFEYRIQQLTEKEGKGEKDAKKAINKDDEERLQWTKLLFEKTPYDEKLYDILIPMQETKVDEAVKIITENALSEPVKTTVASRRAAEDFLLASKVNIALVEAGHDDLEVYSNKSKVTILINEYTSRLGQLKKDLEKIARGVKGVSGIEVKTGPKYTPPAINPFSNIEVPPKILLVDDEKEFVHTLSERLLTRDLETSVVYNGEEALKFVEKDQPDVMVLDLMMPGIDGIEVLRQVKSKHPDVEVIILTGHGSEREENLARDLGAFAYLQKPVDIDVLSKTMKDAYKKVSQVKTDMDGENQDHEEDK